MSSQRVAGVAMVPPAGRRRDDPAESLCQNRTRMVPHSPLVIARIKFNQFAIELSGWL